MKNWSKIPEDTKRRVREASKSADLMAGGKGGGGGGGDAGLVGGNERVAGPIDGPPSIKVKHKGKTVLIPASSCGRVGDLKAALEALVGVSSSMQSLIVKGTILDDTQECPCADSTVMLVEKEMSPTAAAEKDRACAKEEEERELAAVSVSASALRDRPFETATGQQCLLGSTCGQVVGEMLESLKTNGSTYKALEGQLITAQPQSMSVMGSIAVLAQSPDASVGEKAFSGAFNLLLDSLEASAKRAMRLAGVAPMSKGVAPVGEEVAALATTVVAEAIRQHVQGKRSGLSPPGIGRLAKICSVGASVDRGDAEAFVRHLISAREHSCAVDQIVSFNLHTTFPTEQLVATLLERGDYTACEKACKTLECGERVKERVVRSCLDSGHLKDARRIAELWGLSELHAEAQDKYCRAAIDKFVAKGNVVMAVRFGERSRELQVYTALSMMRNGHYDEAMSLRTRFSLENEVPEVSEQVRQAVEAERLARFLQLPPPLQDADAVIFVGSKDGLERASKAVESIKREGAAGGAGGGMPTSIGMDAEWKAVMEKGVESKASILQIASRDHIMIFDLLWIAEGGQDQEGASRLIADLWSDSNIIKTGFDFKNDLRKLTRSHPGLGCFDQMLNFIDVQECARFCNWVPGDSSVSLSNVCQAVLGKALDKREQMSDWERRPLSPEQVRYAALDAHALVSILDAKTSSIPAQCKHESLGVDRTSDGGSGGGGGGAGRKRKGKSQTFSGDAESSASSGKNSSKGGQSREGGGAGGGKQAGMGLAPLGSDTVLKWLEERGVREPVLHTAPRGINMTTMKDAASAFGIHPSRMGKVMAFRAGGEAIVAVSTALRQIDWASLASAAGVERRNLRLASPAECVDWFGYLPPCMPPFAHRTPLRVFIDTALFDGKEGKDDGVYFRVGQENLCVELPRGGGSMLAEMLGTHTCTRVDFAGEGEVNKVRSVGGDMASLRVGGAGALAAINAVGTEAGPSIRLMGDCMLFKIVRWLRCIGVDTAFFESREHDSILKAARDEKRVIITQDNRLASRRDASMVYLLRCKDQKEGLQQVLRDFNIKFENGAFMGRCSKCNTSDYQRISEEKLDALVSEGRLNSVVRDKFDKFYMCMGCEQVFWKGHQYASAKDKIASVLSLQGHIVGPGDLDSDEEDVNRE